MSQNDSFLFLDLSPIIDQYRDVAAQLAEKLDDAAKLLAGQADGKIREWATERLHTRRQQLLDNLHWEPIGKGTYAVVIDAPAVWIEDGSPPHSMLEDLLSSPKAKTVKSGKNKGKKYIVVPFKHNKTKTQTGWNQTQVLKDLQKQLRKRGISSSTTGKLERNQDGSPKLGLLHSFDVAAPTLQQRRRMAANGVTYRAETTEGRSFLSGVRVYQKEVKDKSGNVVKDKHGDSKVERSIFTFRIAEQGQTGKWIHPGQKPQNFLQDAYAWCKEQLDKEIIPSILASLDL